MADRSPEAIQHWLDGNMHRLDGPAQYIGSEPNAECRPWETAAVRWLLAASWDYSQASGNMAIPAVYASIHLGRQDFLCDRWYLPATSRDLELLERKDIPVFGIESKHQARDFDVLATSISYTVLFMNFCKYLSMSGIPLRRTERVPEDHPMVLVGGQAFCAPEFMSPVVDCFWLGEVEDEPGNPGGIAQVCERIALFKETGDWGTRRRWCYDQLALEFSHLYFPHTVEFAYGYQERGLPELSKQVTGYWSTLDGQVFPRRARKVKDLDAITTLDAIPLLFSDPAMGAGDLEEGRGCIGEDEYVFLPGRGIQRLGAFAGDILHPSGLDVAVRRDFSRVSHVLDNGVRDVVQVRTRQGHAITCTPDHRIWTSRGWMEAQFLSPGDEVPVYYGQQVFGPEQALDASASALAGSSNYRHPVDGLRHGNRANGFCPPEKLTPDLAWLLGFLTGDGCLEADGKSAQFMTRVEEPEVAEFVHRKMQELFGLSPVVKPRPGVPVLYHYFYSKPLVRWLQGNFGYSCGKGTEQSKLYVPEKVLQSPRNVQESYLLGLFEADGHCCARPTFSTISERLVRQMSVMLLNLGIPCAFSSKVLKSGKGAGRTHWELRLWKAAAGDRSWFRMLSNWKDRALDGYRRKRVGEFPVRLFCNRGQHYFETTCKSGQSGKCTICGAGVWIPRNSRDAISYQYPEYLTAVVGEVISVAPARVLDLHVPVQEAFNASGFVVHNCPAWCSFCRLSWVTKPYRQRSVRYSVEHAKRWRNNMGSNELSPFAPDFPMHTRKKELLSGLLEQVSDEVSTSSMRVDDFNADADFSMLMAAGGATSITLGLEGNSQRMRDLAGKGTSDDDVAEAVTRAIAAGIRKVKLYMISNWPGEEAGDVMSIVRLAERLARIREDFGERAKGVRIQFSWTPLLIEAQTPLQWFAPTGPDYALQSAMDRLKDLHIDVKIGSKASPPKLAFFQACQRASRDAGEAIVDVLEALGSASWGGFARDMRERLEAALVARGFRNGLADLFGERYEDDLFGWEHIDTGVSKQLMWSAYRDMLEFLESTDAATYDAQVQPGVHGQEWIARCDQKCQGRVCGACDAEDLRLRTGYIRAARDERDLDEHPLQPIDQTTVACRVRMKVKIPEQYRYVSNESLRFIVRRAAYRAGEATGFPHIAKRTVRLASDAMNYRNRKAGIDYVEFGVTRQVDQADMDRFMPAMGAELAPWMAGGVLEQILPAQARLPDRVPSLWELEVSDDPAKVEAALKAWDTAEKVMVLMKSDSFYTGPLQEKENAKDHVADIWLARDKQRHVLKMELTGKLGPYQAYAAILGKSSWLSAAAKTAFCLDFFPSVDRFRGDLWQQQCAGCGMPIPAGLLGAVFDDTYCPRCKDVAEGNLAAGLARVGV